MLPPGVMHFRMDYPTLVLGLVTLVGHLLFLPRPVLVPDLVALQLVIPACHPSITCLPSCPLVRTTPITLLLSIIRSKT